MTLGTDLQLCPQLIKVSVADLHLCPQLIRTQSITDNR